MSLCIHSSISGNFESGFVDGRFMGFVEMGFVYNGERGGDLGYSVLNGELNVC